MAKWWGPRVQGIEVTQAIQHYRAASHLTDPADRGPDNSIRLVANKPAWVRVYVRPGLLANAGVTVAGTLDIRRRSLGFIWNHVATLNPQPPGTVTAPATISYDAERSSVANTLNFIVPADEFWGNLRLTVNLTGVGGGNIIDSETVDINANLRQTLRIRAVLVSYNGPNTANPGPPAPTNLVLAAPTLADLQNTSAIALRIMPVQSTGSFASAGTVAWNRPLDDVRSCPGCCSANWNQLLTALTNQRTADGNRADVVYYGLLPAGIPLNVPGCGQGGLGSAASGNLWTLAHEIGHGYGFQHTPCGNTGAADPNYPTYQPYASASIGEYGLDISNGNVLSPQTARDYMSYCGPTWMSMYQHNRLVEHARLAPVWLTDTPWWRDYFETVPEWWKWPLPDPPPFEIWKWVDMRREPIISITGIVRSTKALEVATVARLDALTTLAGEHTGLTAALLDEQGEVLAEGAVIRLATHGGSGCGCDHDHDPEAGPYNFQAFLPDVGPGATLTIRGSDGEQLWTRRAPKRPPKLGKVTAKFTKDGQLDLRWKHDLATDSPEAWVQWSADGELWNGLAVGVTEPAATLAGEGLPAGKILVRVLVHDGFSTVASEPVEVKVPERAPSAAILHPRDGQTLLAGQTLQLWAAATDQAGLPVAEEACRWVLDDKPVGFGTEVWIAAPRPGEHTVTVTVAGPGGEAEVTSRFITVDPGGNDKRE
jgi:hypothetical protein